MLYFHIANRCRGFDILDDIMTRNKRIYFYNLDVNPTWEEPRFTFNLLYCVPKHVISTCIRHIVEDGCGLMAAGLLQNYLLFIQNRLARALESVGLNSSICEHGMSSSNVPNRPPIPLGHAEFRLPRLLQIMAPGTALDTVFGKFVLSYLDTLYGEEFCTTGNAFATYLACEMASDDRSEKSKFNILQFAHQMIPLSYHGLQCNGLGRFTTCWNLLQEQCGHKVLGLEQHATLLMETCKIQTEMDVVDCHWQDMLLEHYIHASEMTVWPLVMQCSRNPLSLDNAKYLSNGLMDDLDTVITLLQPGILEISKKCGPQPAKRLKLLLRKLRSLQLDAFKYISILAKSPMVI